MEDSIISKLEPPPLTESSIIQGSERSERLNELLLKELKVRDIVNQESQERIDQFLQNAQSEVNFDPSYIEFFSESQERIDILNDRYDRLMKGEMPRPEEIEELEQRINAATSFFSGINTALSTKLTKIETKTNLLKTKQIPELIILYENELLENRKLKKNLEELKSQKQK